jgi:hypothetical protein
LKISISIKPADASVNGRLQQLLPYNSRTPESSGDEETQIEFTEVGLLYNDYGTLNPQETAYRTTWI